MIWYDDGVRSPTPRRLLVTMTMMMMDPYGIARKLDCCLPLGPAYFSVTMCGETFLVLVIIIIIVIIIMHQY
jgi:hypothetical protein